MKKSVLIPVLFVIGILVAGLAQPAHATFILELSDGTTTITVFDTTDGSGGDNNTDVGAITFVGSIGIFTSVNVTSVKTSPALGGPNSAVIDLDSDQDGGPGTLTLKTGEKGYGIVSVPTGMPLLMTNSVSGNLDGGSLTFDTYYDPGNNDNAWSTAVPPATKLSQSPIPDATTHLFTDSASTIVLDSGFFSLAQVVTLTTTGSKSHANFDSWLEITAVPDTGIANISLLLGISLVGLAGFGKFSFRRRKKAYHLVG